MESFLAVTLNSQQKKKKMFLELYEAVEDFKIKTTIFCKKTFQNKNINKIIWFV